MFITTTMASNPLMFLGTHMKLPTFNRVSVTKMKQQDGVLKNGYGTFSSSSNGGKSLFRELGLLRNGLGGLGGRGVLRVGSSSGGDGGSGGFGGGGDGGSGGGGGGGGGGKWSFVSWYLTILEAHPVWTKAITSALLTFVGDLICQIVIDKKQSPDFKRVSIFTFLGMALVGPTLHFWYLYLSKLVTMTGASGALLRLVIDQFIFAPVFIGVFLSTLVTLEGSPSQVLPKLKQEWLSSVIANWQLWIPFQFLNFRFVPQQFQVLASNVIALVWNVILSYKAHKVVAK
ncbi:mpv17/PMP22 [Artemisia annua]|uniref:Mpv17/PMP22 n=1 Tax=Artemisia annua TaxID=35608 RepID=A0A2U1MW08_ARTAN|nr:mpv17/PMP22 [Artemisia annua]